MFLCIWYEKMAALGPCGLASQHFGRFRLCLPIAYVERTCTESNTEPVFSPGAGSQRILRSFVQFLSLLRQKPELLHTVCVNLKSINKLPHMKSINIPPLVKTIIEHVMRVLRRPIVLLCVRCSILIVLTKTFRYCLPYCISK